MGRKLYVGNLPFTMSDEALTELFSQVGKVDSARVVRDQGTGQSRGFGFVEMGTDEEAQRAITQLNQRGIDGRSIAVNEARPKTTEGGRGGYGGGGGGRDRGRGGYGGGGGGGRDRGRGRF
jgi:RNA recognition motif-containing protein